MYISVCTFAFCMHIFCCWCDNAIKIHYFNLIIREERHRASDSCCCWSSDEAGANKVNIFGWSKHICCRWDQIKSKSITARRLPSACVFCSPCLSQRARDDNPHVAAARSRRWSLCWNGTGTKKWILTNWGRRGRSFHSLFFPFQPSNLPTSSSSLFEWSATEENGEKDGKL